MSEQSGGNGHMDPAAWSQAMTRIAEQSQRLVADFVQRNQFQNASGGVDPMARFLFPQQQSRAERLRQLDQRLALFYRAVLREA